MSKEASRSMRPRLVSGCRSLQTAPAICKKFASWCNHWGGGKLTPRRETVRAGGSGVVARTKKMPIFSLALGAQIGKGNAQEVVSCIGAATWARCEAVAFSSWRDPNKHRYTGEANNRVQCWSRIFSSGLFPGKIPFFHFPENPVIQGTQQIWQNATCSKSPVYRGGSKSGKSTN